MLFRSLAVLFAFLACQSHVLAAETATPKAHVRVNLVGYLPTDTKVAVVFSHDPVVGGFTVVNTKTGATVHEGKLTPSETSDWGKHKHHYYADFSKVTAEGDYEVLLVSGATSATIRIGDGAYVIVLMAARRTGRGRRGRSLTRRVAGTTPGTSSSISSPAASRRRRC
jgi:hypothetical protein